MTNQTLEASYAQEVPEILLSVWGYVSHPARWRRFEEAADRRGSPVAAGHPDAASWSLEGAILRAVLRKSEFALTTTAACERLLDEASKERGFGGYHEANREASYEEIVNILDAALKRCDSR